MKRVINWLKNYRPVKVLTVFLAGIVLIVTQACSSPGVATEPPQSNVQPKESGAQPYTKRYDPTKSYDLNNPEGGINNFSDVEPRAKADDKAANDKANALAKNAQKNIDQKGVNNPGEIGKNIRNTPFGQKAKETGEDISDSAAEVGEGVAKGTQRGIENIKENVQNAAKYVKRTGEDTTKGAEVK
ncbi:hypothetical protein I8752_10115 [Nostocaceae cyanobacterium CENA369]|uniref:Uncharacterized protein n=1 Tax=Dendronalium phyllosphericum CENA369 TaxID=1725256 RepID=A0A8J7I031_9NOST|nr:DUF6658 family protein [Dendronalium phyllosphericum]MBH8573361.1 hypothetical protein [Dendronalium phyllosphericum CENA369]